MVHAAARHKEPGASSSPIRRELFSHLVVLILCFCIIVGALALQPPNADNPYVRLFGISLPNTCTFKGITGLPCPGCGLVRSIVSAMHGDVAMSFAHHRLGLLTIAYIFLQFLYRLGFFLIPIKWARFVRFGKYLNRGIIVLGILFFLNWILTLLNVVTLL